MIDERPIEITHLPAALRELFTGLLHEPRANDPQGENNFLSRALAAFTLIRLGGANAKAAAEAVVDGGADCGIDAVYHHAPANTLFVVQSKWIEDGRGEPDLSGVGKFRDGLSYLLRNQFEAFAANTAMMKKAPLLKALFDQGGMRVQAILVHSGIRLLAEDRQRILEDIQARFSPEDDYLTVQVCNLTTVHEWLTESDQGRGVDQVVLTILKPGWVMRPFETLYGLVSLKQLADLHAEHGKKLITANIRGYKGRTEVNDGILATARDEPNLFLYLNNGLTAYCERLEVMHADRDNMNSKRVTARGFSIVNGAQTLGSVSKAEPTEGGGFAFLRLISLEKCEDERSLADRITRSTNFQNRIDARDFAALDEQQEHIARQLVLSGVTYHYKADDGTPPADQGNFTMEEATTACACLARAEAGDFCARVLSNRRSLWSIEEEYGETESPRTRYERVFRTERSARTIWRAVQAQRIVSRVMTENARSDIGVRKAFFENSRWLVLNVVFQKHHPERGENLQLTLQEEALLAEAALECAEALFAVCEAQGFVSRKVVAVGGAEAYDTPRHFRSVFSSAADCQTLRSGVLAKLAESAAVPHQPPETV